MVLKLYVDLLSQPSRALYILLKKTGIPFEPCIVQLGKGEHLTDEFKEKYNKFQKVPFIHDGDFKLAESVGIVRYLSREHHLPDQWYAKDSKQQARMDEYLEWQHLNIRLYCAMYFQTRWLFPKIGVESSPDFLKMSEKNLKKSLKDFQNLFLSDDKKFIFGDQLTYADLAAACEIEQPRIAGYDPTEHYPKIKKWIENVRKESNPYYAEAHVLLNKLAAQTEKLKGKL